MKEMSWKLSWNIFKKSSMWVAKAFVRDFHCWAKSGSFCKNKAKKAVYTPTRMFLLAFDDKIASKIMYVIFLLSTYLP